MGGEDISDPMKDLMSVGKDDSRFQEQFKALRSKLEYKTDLAGWKVIGVTSSIAGEGKTLFCAKMAANMAYTKRKKVLLVDADIRKADLTKGLGNPLAPGLTDFLRNETGLGNILRSTNVPDLFSISAGTTVQVSSDLLAGERFGTFLHQARERFDFVLLDSPPVLPIADALSMRESLDAYIMIYRAGFTPISMFRQAVEELGEKKILGAVLNGVEPQSEKFYGRYYGKYYANAPICSKERRD